MKSNGKMLWRKLARKIFKDRRHVGITLYPTSQCDTGCSHCIDSSDCKNPVHFTKELAETIVNEARKERWMLSVLLTGGGEPLMTPEFLGIADTFASYERLNHFGIITSGFTEKETFRKAQLEAFLKRDYAKKVLIEQSFNLYQESFPERLTNIARLMLSTADSSRFFIRACMSLENAEATSLKIEKLCRDLAKQMEMNYLPVPLGRLKEERRLFDIFTSTNTDEKTAYNLWIETFLVPQWHVIKAENGGLVMIVQPISFEQTGKGKCISQTPFGLSVCDSIARSCEDVYLIVGPDGYVYPDCSCYPTEHMRLGRIGEDSLAELVRRKDHFSEGIARAIFADSRMCEWGTNEVCILCKQIVAEKGISLR